VPAVPGAGGSKLSLVALLGQDGADERLRVVTSDKSR
jgi:hypothetical protein